MAKKDQRKSQKEKDKNRQDVPAQGTTTQEEVQEQTVSEENEALDQESQAEDTEEEQLKPLGPDPKKETIVMQFPKDGRIQVLSEITTTKEDKPHYITVDPSLKNHPKFYEIRNSRELAAQMMDYNRQFKDWKTETPKYYRVPHSEVATLAMALTTLTQDPTNVDAQSIQKQYATNPFALEKIIFDKERMPIAILEKAGFNTRSMAFDNAFKQMENGQFTKRLYTRKEEINGMKIEGTYAIRAVHDENGGIAFEAMTPQSVEQLKEDPILSRLDEKTRFEVLGGKTLPYPVMHDGQLCFAGINRMINRAIYVPCSDYPAPYSIYGNKLDNTQQQAVSRGERILFRDCFDKDDDPTNHYDGYAQFDINKMQYEIGDKVYERPHLPKSILEQLDAEERKIVFEKDGYIRGNHLRAKNGERFPWMIGINPVTNNIQYISIQRYELAAAQAQKEGGNVKDYLNNFARRKSVEQVPDIATNNKRKGQSM